MTTKNTENNCFFTCVVANGAKGITSVLDYFFTSCLLYDLLCLCFFLNTINLNHKNTDCFVYFASYLWCCYSETRGLHTANSVATSSS